MNADTAAKLKLEVQMLQGQASMVDSLISTVQSSASAPAMSPSGPVHIPALMFIAQAMKAQKDVTEKLIKLVDKMLDESIT